MRITFEEASTEAIKRKWQRSTIYLSVPTRATPSRIRLYIVYSTQLNYHVQ